MSLQAAGSRAPSILDRLRSLCELMRPRPELGVNFTNLKWWHHAKRAEPTDFFGKFVRIRPLKDWRRDAREAALQRQLEREQQAAIVRRAKDEARRKADEETRFVSEMVAELSRLNGEVERRTGQLQFALHRAETWEAKYKRDFESKKRKQHMDRESHRKKRQSSCP